MSLQIQVRDESKNTERCIALRAEARQRYVLVTPARNEDAYIANTIESILAQTVRPQKWVIVSDGSTDRTDEIVTYYAGLHRFIQLVRMDHDGRRPKEKDFGAKVRAFHAGYCECKGIPYEFVGNLDADIVMAPGYFAALLGRFAFNPRLGIGGGIVLEPQKNRFVPQNTSLNSVCGAVQLFRRECYEAIGGYLPIRMGGVDAAAEIMCRMRGWQVQTFRELEVRAKRRVLTGGSTILHTRYRRGAANYLLGYHPIFELATCVARLTERPYVFGSIAALVGYAVQWLRRDSRSLPDDVIGFLRAEQIMRLLNTVRLRPIKESDKSLE